MLYIDQIVRALKNKDFAEEMLEQEAANYKELASENQVKYEAGIEAGWSRRELEVFQVDALLYEERAIDALKARQVVILYRELQHQH